MNNAIHTRGVKDSLGLRKEFQRLWKRLELREEAGVFKDTNIYKASSTVYSNAKAGFWGTIRLSELDAAVYHLQFWDDCYKNREEVKVSIRKQREVFHKNATKVKAYLNGVPALAAVQLNINPKLVDKFFTGRYFQLSFEDLQMFNNSFVKFLKEFPEYDSARNVIIEELPDLMTEDHYERLKKATSAGLAIAPNFTDRYPGVSVNGLDLILEPEKLPKEKALLILLNFELALETLFN